MGSESEAECNEEEEAMIFLLQAGALWEEGPEEVYLHIPLVPEVYRNRKLDPVCKSQREAGWNAGNGDP